MNWEQLKIEGWLFTSFSFPIGGVFGPRILVGQLLGTPIPEYHVTLSCATSGQ